MGCRLAPVRTVMLRLLAILLGSSLALLVAEFGAAVTLARGGTDQALALRQLAAPPASTTLGAHQSRQVLHPYVGAVAAPGTRDRGNELGFPGLDPRAPRPPDVARVALVGGSVAKGQVEADGAATSLPPTSRTSSTVT